MAISLHCPTCNAPLKVPDDAAGRTLRCPACRALAPAPQRPKTLPGAPSRPSAAGPNFPKKPAEGEEAYQDLEVIGDGSDVLEEVQALAEDEGVDTLEEVFDADDLEEVLPVGTGDLLAESRLLDQREIYIRARKYNIAEKVTARDLRDYDLCLPDGGKRLGRGLEVRDAGVQAARLSGMGHLVSKRFEIRESPDDELLATIRRAPMPLALQRTLEVCDGGGRPIGRFAMPTWGAVAGEPSWISSPSGDKRILQMKLQPSRRRYLFLTPADRPAAELVHEEQGLRINWGGIRVASSYYLRFRPSLDGRPRDKLLCLAVALGLEA